MMGITGLDVLLCLLVLCSACGTYAVLRYALLAPAGLELIYEDDWCWISDEQARSLLGDQLDSIYEIGEAVLLGQDTGIAFKPLSAERLPTQWEVSRRW